jgi:Trypsin-like peptidase domain
VGTIDTLSYYFPVVAVRDDDQVVGFRGTAFAVAPGGCLVTCRHVVETDDGSRPAIFDRAHNRVLNVSEIATPPESTIDLAYLPNALGDPPPSEFMPLMTPSGVIPGTSVTGAGFYATGNPFPIELGSFSGNIVASRPRGPTQAYPTLALQFPVIEGMSGAPITTYHHGTKVYGVCYGSESRRVVAAEAIEVEEGETRYKETVHRIVEVGLAFHANVVAAFLADVGAEDFVVSDGRVEGTGLED